MWPVLGRSFDGRRGLLCFSVSGRYTIDSVCESGTVSSTAISISTAATVKRACVSYQALELLKAQRNDNGRVQVNLAGEYW
jgi:hypothetical protein